MMLGTFLLTFVGGIVILAITVALVKKLLGLAFKLLVLILKVVTWPLRMLLELMFGWLIY